MSSQAPRYDVFISYSRGDQEAAKLLGQKLAEARVTYYLDQESGQSGDEWVSQIKKAIDRCSYFALIYSEKVNDSNFVNQEVEYADRVIARRGWIWLDSSPWNARIDKMLGDINAVRSNGSNREQAIQEFADSIVKSLGRSAQMRGAAGIMSPENCPYRPYRPYEKDNELFGRGAEIKAIVAAVDRAIEHKDARRIADSPRLIFVYGPSGAGKSSLIASGVIRKLSSLNAMHIVGPVQPRAVTKTLEEYAAEANGKPCIIAIDQFEEIWKNFTDSWSDLNPESYSKEAPQAFLDGIKNTFNNEKYKNVVIIIGFREEYLASVERLFLSIKNQWYRHPIRPLDRVDAEDCIRGPAREHRIEYEDLLVEALVKVLSKMATARGANGEELFYVEPVELQIVCARLWEKLCGQKTIEKSQINSSDLLSVCRSLDSTGTLDLALHSSGGLSSQNVEDLAKTFLREVTDKFLDDAVNEISDAKAAAEARYNNPERIYYALRLFVGEANKRLSLKVHTEGGKEWVGRLPMFIVDEMTRKSLLRKAVDIPGEERYELVHDRLVDKILAQKSKMELYYAASSLGAEMTKIKQKQEGVLNGWFEDYQSTIKDVNEFQNFQGLDSEEAEFIFRSALSYDRSKKKDFDQWVSSIREQHPSVLSKVLENAFLSYCSNSEHDHKSRTNSNQKLKTHANKNVLINGATLLRNKEFQQGVGNDGLSALMSEVKDLILRETIPDDALEELCETLATCPRLKEGPSSCSHLAKVMPDQKHFAQLSPQILLWMRDKAKLNEEGCFVVRWKKLPLLRRAWLMLRLLWLRFYKAFLRMLVIVFVSTVTTALGAAAMFFPLGILGASFTEANSLHGGGQGIFHGVFGGIIWGSFTSAATLFYWLVLRGRRIRKKKITHWLGGIFLTGFAGLLGGIVLTIMVLNVDTAASATMAGWLASEKDPLFSTFSGTGWGWILPIYGLFMGLGVGWSMLNLYHDEEFRAFVKSQDALKSVGQFVSWTRQITLRTLRWGLPPAIGLGIAAVLVFFIFRGHSLDCRPYQWVPRPERCVAANIPMIGESKNPAIWGWRSEGLAPLGWRSVGMGLIILAGPIP